MENPNVQFIKITNIHVREGRQRGEFDAEKLRDLESSIAEKGLLHPIGVETHPEYPDQFYLIYGERRLRSFFGLYKGENTIHFGGDPIPPDCIAAAVYPVLTPLLRAELELEENIRRDDLSWHERVKALDAIAKLHPELNNVELAQQLAPKMNIGPKSAADQLTQATSIMAHMQVPAVARARTQREAYQAVLKHKENRIAAVLASRAKDVNDHRIQITHGDMTKVMPDIPDGTFDLLLADLPYGLDADTAFGKKVETKHNYRDDEEYARTLAKHCIEQGFRITKTRANLFIFCKPLMFHHLYAMAQAMLWTPFPMPIIWDKGPGYAPWGNLGFRSNYEMIFWASKGQRGLNYLVENIIRGISSVRDREHGAQKPIELLSILIEASTHPNDKVLDPTCGSGSTLIAARRLNRQAMGIEFDQDYYLAAKARLEEEANGSGSPTKPEATPDREVEQ